MADKKIADLVSKVHSSKTHDALQYLYLSLCTSPTDEVVITVYKEKFKALEVLGLCVLETRGGQLIAEGTELGAEVVRAFVKVTSHRDLWEPAHVRKNRLKEERAALEAEHEARKAAPVVEPVEASEPVEEPVEASEPVESSEPVEEPVKKSKGRAKKS